MLVEAVVKGNGKGKGKTGKCESKDTKSKYDRGKSKKSKIKDSSDKSHDSKDSAQRNVSTATVQDACRETASNVLKTQGNGRKTFVDKSKSVSALQATHETPAVTLAPDFDGHLRIHDGQFLE